MNTNNEQRTKMRMNSDLVNAMVGNGSIGRRDECQTALAAAILAMQTELKAGREVYLSGIGVIGFQVGEHRLPGDDKPEKPYVRLVLLVPATVKKDLQTIVPQRVLVARRGSANQVRLLNQLRASQTQSSEGEPSPSTPLTPCPQDASVIEGLG